ncbi:MAG: hypothetical protein JNM43_04880 [Planctomycetaceae bacterium]|nr:hypothetical protein [Planctomycetaceae bacterium]
MKTNGQTPATTQIDLLSHPMYTPSDLAYFESKGYTPTEILAFWDRDLAAGKEPLHHRPAPAILEYLTQTNVKK